jgi:uncharacterized protein (DUF1800 family)
MVITRRNLAFICVILAFAAICAEIALAKKKAKATFQMNEQMRAEHALNRLAFGPRPGDVAQVTAMGVDKWIDLQLHPEKINDDALETRLAPLRTLQMSAREMAEEFPSQQVIKQVADGKLSMPSSGPKHAVYMAAMEKYEEKIDRKQQAADTTQTAAPNAAQQNATQQNAAQQGDQQAVPQPTQVSQAQMPAVQMSDEQVERQKQRQMGESDLPQLLDQAPDARFKAIMKLPTEEQVALASLNDRERDPLLEGMAPEQRETMEALRNPQQVVTDELMQGKLLRAVYSDRQLQEVMTDFWFNHFNVFIGKGADRYMLTSYERDVIRAHAFGKFEDLLVATAQSPAMLFYLDNWLSVGPHSDIALGIPKRPNYRGGWRRFPPPPRPQRQANAKRPSGLNENYGRELMELHTLGVNGGYTQKDVTEVARVFTGWTLKDPRDGGGFFFDERKHDPGDKMVLGHRIKPNGEKEGLEVLHLLAHNPATAHFICTKLAMRFVSDNPSPQLVDAMANTFLKKDGDIREVMKTMLSSPEFWAQDDYRAKVKTPLEFVASALRATGADVTNATPLMRQLQAMGMPLYGAQPPTGYSMKAETWVNSSALLARMNFALALASGKLRGSSVDVHQVLVQGSSPTDADGMLAAVENNLLEGNVSKQTHDTIEARLQDPAISQRRLDDPARPPDVGMIEGLLLGSPEFQRR